MLDSSVIHEWSIIMLEGTLQERETRLPGKSATGERIETIEELVALFPVIQRMGHRLAYESRGDVYVLVNELNSRLHLAGVQLEKIRQLLLAPETKN